MDGKQIEEILITMSFEMDAQRICGMDAYPLLSVDGFTVFARPKTLLAARGFNAFGTVPGVEFTVVDPDGVPCDIYEGCRLHAGRSECSTDRFVELFGHLFDRNALSLPTGSGAFDQLLAQAM